MRYAATAGLLPEVAGAERKLLLGSRIVAAALVTAAVALAGAKGCVVFVHCFCILILGKKGGGVMKGKEGRTKEDYC